MATGTKKPLSYGIVVFTGFQALDAMGPIDFLSFLDFPDLKGKIAEGTSLTWLAESLSPVSTKGPTLARLNPRVAAAVLPDDTFSSFLSSDKTIDVLIIPGGIGTREPVDAVLPARDFIRQIAPRVTTAIITICTGSDLLASTGLLDNQNVQATTNVRRFDLVSTRSKEANRNIQWLYKARWVKSSIPTPRALEIWTSAGVSAGMDVMLAFISEKYGRDVAVQLTRMSEHDWKELKSGELDPMYNDWA